MDIKKYQCPKFWTTPKIGENKLYHIVYVIRHKRTGCYYIGVKSNTDPDCVWKTYFSSSKQIKNIIKLEGESAFFCQMKMFFSTRNDAYKHEQYLIEINSPEEFPLLLNKAFIRFSKENGQKLVKHSWPTTIVNGVCFQINPKCPILNLEYRCKYFPRVLLRLP